MLHASLPKCRENLKGHFKVVNPKRHAVRKNMDLQTIKDVNIINISPTPVFSKSHVHQL